MTGLLHHASEACFWLGLALTSFPNQHRSNSFPLTLNRILNRGYNHFVVLIPKQRTSSIWLLGLSIGPSVNIESPKHQVVEFQPPSAPLPLVVVSRKPYQNTYVLPRFSLCSPSFGFKKPAPRIYTFSITEFLGALEFSGHFETIPGRSPMIFYSPCLSGLSRWMLWRSPANSSNAQVDPQHNSTNLAPFLLGVMWLKGVFKE